MTKRIFVLLILVGLLIFPLHVEAGKKPTKPRKVKTVEPLRRTDVLNRYSDPAIQRRISNLLRKRVQTTFQQAANVHLSLGEHLRSHSAAPVSKMLELKNKRWREIYPDKPFLTTQRQAANYMLARSNRLFIREEERIVELSIDIWEHFPQLKEAAQNTPQVEEYVSWTVKQIPSKTNLLFLGEVHYVREIQQSIKEFIELLAQRRKGQKIFLFTEFLPENVHYTKENLQKTEEIFVSKREIWVSALENDIEVIGLEPSYVFGDRRTKTAELNAEGTAFGSLSQWGHLEGMRLRNEAWVRIIEKYRAENPDALFVVYTGSAHIKYNYPFTLSHTFANENPFVIALCPSHAIKKVATLDNGEIVRDVVPYHDMLEQIAIEEFAQRAIQITDPELALLAGFDIRLKIPVDRKRLLLKLLFQDTLPKQ